MRTEEEMGEQQEADEGDPFPREPGPVDEEIEEIEIEGESYKKRKEIQKSKRQMKKTQEARVPSKAERQVHELTH